MKYAIGFRRTAQSHLGIIRPTKAATTEALEAHNHSTPVCRQRPALPLIEPSTYCHRSWGPSLCGSPVQEASARLQTVCHRLRIESTMWEQGDSISQDAILHTS